MTPLFSASRAANEEPRRRPLDPHERGAEINDVLVRVSEHIASHTHPSTSVLLTPLHTTFNVYGDEDTFAFVIAGLLAVSARDRASDTQGQLQLCAALIGEELVITVRGPSSPSQ
ncbi:MAG: hypothetical protein ACPHRO_11640, partial [Nannocystaceae bacterium]